MNDRQDGPPAPPIAAAGGDASHTMQRFLAGPWPFAILLLLAALPYLGILRNDFVYTYDDKPLILDSAYVHSAQHLREVLTSTLFSNQGAPGGPPITGRSRSWDSCSVTRSSAPRLPDFIW